MIKVLLVEDEPPIGRAIQKMIEQTSPAFFVVGCAINGQAALDWLVREPVDVVITDIRMPVMDGIELLEEIKQRHPECIAVVQSGYQDFGYAQSALRLGAFDYLLKPLSRDKLGDLLGRLEDYCSMREVEKKRMLLQQSLNRPPVEKKGDAATCAVFLACVGAWPLSPDDSMTPGAAFWEPLSPETLVEANLVEGESVLVFEGKFRPERVFVLENVPEERLQEVVGNVYKNFSTRATPVAVTLCAYPERLAIWEVGTIIRALRARLYNSIRLCCSQLFWETDIPQKREASLSVLPVAEIVEALCAKNHDLLAANVEDAVHNAVNAHMTQLEFCHFLDAVICDPRLQTPRVADIKADITEAVSNVVSPDGLAKDLFAILNQFNAAEFNIEQKDVITRMEQYLERNYNRNITNEMLSRQFGFVPSYISKIFRRHKGVSPSEYITFLRMEKAKATISRQPELRMREVAQMVGYQDPYYFSKAFKKETGMWPTQYQQSIK